MWMLYAFTLYLSIDIVKSTVDYLQHPVKSCRIGDVVENECNKCLCTSKTVFECKALDCNKSKNPNEFEASVQLCYPNQLYVQNLITCICTKDGKWPHKSCQDTFQSLPPSNVVKHKCEPDTYVRVDCNVCRCGPKGDIIIDRCTRNACDEVKRRAYPTTNSVYSTCETKNWYSLAPCQFCFCVNQNKLMCNTGNYYTKKLELGSYNLRVCGKDLIREAIELIPDSQKALRLGLDTSNMSTTTTTKNDVTYTDATPTTVSKTEEDRIIHNNQNIAIEVNRESNEKKTNPNIQLKPDDVSNSKDEYYSDSEEETMKPTVTPKPTATTTATTAETKTTDPQELKGLGLSTKFPIQEGDEMLIESDIKEEDIEEDSNEMVVDLGINSIFSTTNPTKEISLQSSIVQTEQELKLPKDIAREAKSAESYQYVGNTLQINLPKVLNKVFQLALRKSMVSLSKGTKCVPGSTTVNDCNVCFCLKNAKLLCTNNKCGEKTQ